MAENTMNLAELLAKDVATLTTEELNFIVSYTAKLRAVTKVAKEKGVIAKVTAKVEKSPEVQLLANAFEAIIEANLDVIKALFPVSEEKLAGAKGFNIGTSVTCPFYIQILNREAFKLDAENRKAEKEAEKAAEKAAEAEQH